MEKQNKRLKGKLLSGLVTALLIFSVCFCLLVFTQVISRGYVSLFGYSFFRVTTGSMEPELPIGTIIITHKEDIADVELDDIVSFYSKEPHMKGSIITHRVVIREVTANGSVLLTTRGDANSAADTYFVDQENFIGKLVWNSKGDNPLANAIAFLSGKTGFFTCIALPALLVAVMIFKKTMGTMLTEMKKIRAQMDDEIYASAEPETRISTPTEEIRPKITQSPIEVPAEKPAPPEATPAKLNDYPTISAREFDEIYDRIFREVMKELTENDRDSIEK